LVPKELTVTTATDIIKGALRRINSYQSGETIAPPDLEDCLETLNDLLDSWSTEKLHIFGTNEWVLQWVAGQMAYKVGNPTCTSIGEPPFTGTLSGGSPLISGVTNQPIDLNLGATVTDSQNRIPAGTTIINLSPLTMSANALSNSQGNTSITYTIPGDFAIPRPLRITGGFTRINELDFTLDVFATQEQYTEILFKFQPGPWPTIAWYNPQMPYGILNVYQSPGMGAELHLFTDTILSNLTATQTFIMPQGYARAVKWNLAKEICAEYGFLISESIKTNAKESLNAVKALNAQPPMISKYDRALISGARPDGGWIITGGYR
jgi:hypothetical protein